MYFPDKPQINSSGLPNNTGSWLHHNSTLICLADGNPDPVVTWSKKDKELFRGKTSGRIHVVPENSSDFGFYICTAQNSLGKDEFHVEVVRTGENSLRAILLVFKHSFGCRHEQLRQLEYRKTYNLYQARKSIQPLQNARSQESGTKRAKKNNRC